jgi:diguanylate cyclase (GGDEF)-like protein
MAFWRQAARTRESGYWIFALICGIAALVIDVSQSGPLASDLVFVGSGFLLAILAGRGVIKHALAISINIALGMAVLALETHRHDPDATALLFQTQSAFVCFGVFALAAFGGRFALALGLTLAALTRHHSASEIGSFAFVAVFGAGGLMLNYSLYALEKSRAELQQLAFVDPLTRLPNRRSAESQFDSFRSIATRNKMHLMIMVWDLDGLKAVNDGQGHAAGDAYITQFSACLRATLRKGDVAFRIGGDEFLSFHLNLDDGDIVTQRVRQQFPHVSVGWSKDTSGTLDELVQISDAQMYKDKAARRKPVAI